ncbi:MAG: threonylcarbamoyl-AMP synthase, partial [Alphaproteobacteria bacterium GM7ARS4]|nr:threonylcarbamoyl-AMP synthase [Alphaproteobacteria bacterium GM7ARS4]
MRALDCFEASSLLARGGIVAFPTETVYGLGVRGDDSDAVARLYRVKSRLPENPLIIHIRRMEHARRYAVIDDVSERLMARLWPGPVTFVLPRKKDHRYPLADNALAYLPTIALRVPSHPVAQQLLSLCHIPLAAPSANRSTYLSTTSAQDVAYALEACAIDGLIDGGLCAYGLESTIL